MFGITNNIVSSSSRSSKGQKEPRSSFPKLVASMLFFVWFSISNILSSLTLIKDGKNEEHLSTAMDIFPILDCGRNGSTDDNNRGNANPTTSMPISNGYDVLDIGSSKGGGSINFLPHAVSKLNFIEAKTGQLLDARTLGLDYDPEKVKICNEANVESRNDCLLFDILHDTPSDLQLGIGIDTNTANTTRTISGNSYWHVLEHIPDCQLAQQMWIKAAEFSERFSSFHGPAFDNELSQTGKKPIGPHRFWENWSGHTCHFNSTMLAMAISKVSKTKAYLVVNYGKIETTGHNIIVPKDTPQNSHHYDPETMSSKGSSRQFDPTLYEEMRACAIYDQDIDQLSLYSALCLSDALKGPSRIQENGHLVKACAINDREFTSLEDCAQELKQKAQQTIRYFEQLPSDKVLQSI